MATFYLGYKREETDTAIALAKEIESLGHTPIFDALAIAPGQNWRDVLLRALSTADAMVPILSEKALNSKFLMAEIGSARALQFKFGRPLLLPVLVGEVPMPEIVSDLFTVRMANDLPSISATARELVRALEVHTDRTKRGFPKIFISHRHADVAVVEALVKVLTTAFEIEPTDLRCTSVHPYRLKAGDRTSDRLRVELERADAVLGIISPNVKDSTYVLFELGASWGRAGITMPLLVQGATSADVPSPLGDLHTLSLTEEAEAYQLIDDLADVVDLK
jgi:hypothetical protein